MEEIDITKHNQQRSPHSNFNLMPLIILGLIIFVLMRVDLKSFFESEQLKKNVNYVKNYITVTFSTYSSKINDSFLKTDSLQNTNKTGIFNLNNFLPQINSIEVQNNTNINGALNPDEKQNTF